MLSAVEAKTLNSYKEVNTIQIKLLYLNKSSTTLSVNQKNLEMIKFNSLQKVFILFLLSFLPLLGFSQKVTFNNVKVKYTQLPLYPLSEEIKTYEARLVIEIPEEMGKPDQMNNQYLKIQGYKKVKDGGY